MFLNISEKICDNALDCNRDVFLSRFILEVTKLDVPDEVNVFDKFILSVDIKLNLLNIFACTKGNSDKFFVFFTSVKILSEIFFIFSAFFVMINR